MKTKAFKTAFPYTIPIMTSFLALGLAYGIYMNASGFSFVYPMVTAAVIFGGSLEFVTGKMLLSPFSPLQTLTVALMIQLRHLFYGISMLDRYKDTGRKKGYLIFGMCDETFSINYTANIPEGLGILATVIVHRIKGNMLLSILCGTVCYMAVLHIFA